jgi:hypothetical protein
MAPGICTELEMAPTDGALRDDTHDRHQNFEIVRGDLYRHYKLTYDLERYIQGILASRDFFECDRTLELIPHLREVDTFQHDEYARDLIG